MSPSVAIVTDTLTKGGNAPLARDRVRVVVQAGATVDVSALLCGATGKVRSDADMVFYNQPQGPGVRWTPDGVELELPAVPADVDKVAITASLDGSGPPSFGAAGAVRVLVQAAGEAQPLALFDVTGLSQETALVCLEVYRRAGAWKVRAVGQGWASGLAGIATDYGITVDDPGPQTSGRTPPPPPPPPPPSYPPPTGPPLGAAPAPGTVPPPPAPVAAAGHPVNLDKGRVSLQKRQTVSLVKTGAPPLSKVTMGLGWDPADGGAQIDLDASVIAFDARGKDIDKVWFMGKKGLGGAIVHSGDNLTGAGEGDDEQIRVDLSAIPPQVVALVFTVNSFSGQRFTEVRSAFCRLLDANGVELVRFDLSESKPSTGVVMCALHRDPGSGGQTWMMTGLGEFADGKTVRAMVEPARALLAVR